MAARDSGVLERRGLFLQIRGVKDESEEWKDEMGTLCLPRHRRLRVSLAWLLHLGAQV
jgi:hypothetical protein